MKTWIILLIFIALWMASIPSFGMPETCSPRGSVNEKGECCAANEADLATCKASNYEMPKADYPVTGIFIQHERLVLVFQDEVQWSVPVDQKCMEKEITKHTLYMGLYCARWTEIRYER